MKELVALACNHDATLFNYASKELKKDVKFIVSLMENKSLEEIDMIFYYVDLELAKEFNYLGIDLDGKLEYLKSKLLNGEVTNTLSTSKKLKL